jgi:hypothetical protein
MSLRNSTLIGDTLLKLPANLVRHLIILECAKLALKVYKQEIDQNQPEASCGASDVANNILEQLYNEPTELFRYKLNGNEIDGVRLSSELFKPVNIDNLNLSTFESEVYGAALYTAELQMRPLYDCDLIWGDKN